MVANNTTQLALLESKLLWPKERLHGLLSLDSARSVFLGLEENIMVSMFLGLLLSGEMYFRLYTPLKKMGEIDETREEQM